LTARSITRYRPVDTRKPKFFKAIKMLHLEKEYGLSNHIAMQ